MNPIPLGSARASVLLRLGSALLLLASACPHTIGARNATQETSVTQRVAAEGYLSNRESFPFLTCNFTLTSGSATSEEEAIRGELTNKTIAEVRWIVDNHLLLYQMKVDPRILQEAKSAAVASGSSTFSVPMDSEAILNGGGWSLGYSPGLESANISAKNAPQRPILISPFGMEFMGPGDALNPGVMLQACLSGSWRCHEIKSERYADRDVMLVAMGPDASTVKMRYWLDVERGHSPLRASRYGADGNETTRVVWTEITKCSNDRWFPVRAVAISYPNATRKAYAVKHVQVVSFDVDKRPARSAFQLDLPRGTTICDPDKPLAFVKVTEQRAVTVDELPSLYEKCLEAEQRHRNGRAEPDRTRLTQSKRWLFGAITGTALGVLVLGAGTVWYFRRRAYRRAAGLS